MLKYILIIFFYFLKIIFNINTSNRSKTYKPYSILIKKNSKFLKTQQRIQNTETSTQFRNNSKLINFNKINNFFKKKHHLEFNLISSNLISSRKALVKHHHNTS